MIRNKLRVAHWLRLVVHRAIHHAGLVLSEIAIELFEGLVEPHIRVLVVLHAHRYLLDLQESHQVSKFG